jgi:hypothetical protein
VCTENGSVVCGSGGGTCTGAPMNQSIYPMSGSGTWGGFSPCSQKEIGDRLDASAQTACLVQLVCGDANFDGIVSNSDAALALNISVGLKPYADLANVYPIGSPDQNVTTSDASYIQHQAVGDVSYPTPTICGTPKHPYRWVNIY